MKNHSLWASWNSKVIRAHKTSKHMVKPAPVLHDLIYPDVFTMPCRIHVINSPALGSVLLGCPLNLEILSLVPSFPPKRYGY